MTRGGDNCAVILDQLVPGIELGLGALPVSGDMESWTPDAMRNWTPS